MPVVSPAVAYILHLCQFSAYEVSQLGLLTDTSTDFMGELPLVTIPSRVALSGFNIPALTVVLS